MSPSAKLKPPVGANDHAQGAANAPVTVVEYGDYECPYCGEAYPVTKALQKRLGDKLRFVFRNFPLAEMHPHAEHAAEAAEAAGAQGKFWEMHDLLYEHQDALEDEDWCGTRRRFISMCLDSSRRWRGMPTSSECARISAAE